MAPVPHGLSNAMLLPAITRFGLDAVRPRHAAAAQAAGFGEDGQALCRGLDALNRDLHAPPPPYPPPPSCPDLIRASTRGQRTCSWPPWRWRQQRPAPVAPPRRGCPGQVRA